MEGSDVLKHIALGFRLAELFDENRDADAWKLMKAGIIGKDIRNEDLALLFLKLRGIESEEEYESPEPR